MAGKVAVQVAAAPDHALQRLQRGRFPILIHKPVERGDQRIDVGLRLANLRRSAFSASATSG